MDSLRLKRKLLVSGSIFFTLLVVASFFLWKTLETERANAPASLVGWRKVLVKAHIEEKPAFMLRKLAGLAYKQHPEALLPTLFLAIAEYKAGHVVSARSYLESGLSMAETPKEREQIERSLRRIEAQDPQPFDELFVGE